MSHLGHKRERSLGLAQSQSQSQSPPDSLSPLSSSASDSTTEDRDGDRDRDGEPDDDGDDEWTERATAPPRRKGSACSARRRVGSSTDALRTLQMQQGARPGRASRPRRSLAADDAHEVEYALARPHDLDLSATSHAHAHALALGQGAFLRHPASAMQPPSLSPMTLNSPFFPHSAPAQFDYAFTHTHTHPHPSDGEPVSPYDVHAYDPADYASSYASQLQLEFLSSSTTAHPSPFPGPAPPASAYTLPGEPSRSKLKRSHSSTPHAAVSTSCPSPGVVVVPENGAFLHRQHEPFGEPFVGPQTELEAAAAMAAMAAAKTGAGAGAFVYKVYHMLLDDASQHLIAFNAKGTSFIVSNTVLFSRDVLPKYFKHSNFSSFVRQLNMYNFHKVNKTPRGASRALAESQEWEFTHPKFVRGKPHQLEEIKRKAPESALPDPPSASMTRSLSLGTDYTLAGTTIPREQRDRDERLSQSARSSSSSRAGPPVGGAPLVPLAPLALPPSSSTLAPSPPAYTMPTSQSTYLPPPPPQRSASHDGATRRHSSMPMPMPMPMSAPIAPLPIPARVQQLEQQRYELATALAGTQDGYEALYRDLVDSRRREDALVQIVEELYGVVQRNFSGQLPYQFPSHVFAPRIPSPPSTVSHPQISVTHALGPPTTTSPSSYPSSSPSSFHDPYAPSSSSTESMYHPQPLRQSTTPHSLSDSGYYGSPTFVSGPPSSAQLVGLGLSATAAEDERWGVGMAQVEGSSLSAFAGSEDWVGESARRGVVA